MIEIGPNLLAAVLALVSLATAVVAAYRAEHAHSAAQSAQRGVAANKEAIAEMRNNGPK